MTRSPRPEWGVQKGQGFAAGGEAARRKPLISSYPAMLSARTGQRVTQRPQP
jgi:hypothetical protein